MKKKLRLCFTFSILYSAFFISNSAFAQPGEWTWMSGTNTVSSAGVFGTMGVPSTLNYPPAMYEGAQWTDKQGNFWIYGGQDIPNINYLADLWRYNPSTNEWTWIMGPGGTFASPASFGTMGVSSPTNTPGNRGWGPATFTDNNGDLWFFGGTQTGQGDMNDLWKYNIASNEWTWMHGSSTGNPAGNYGTLGVPSPLNDPPYRHETPCAWVDDNNNLWQFGGLGGGSKGDLWKYDIAAGMWTWMHGSQGTSAPVYGTIRVPSPLNDPGSRYVYCSWKDRSNQLWLFGGTSSMGEGNDLWMYNIATDEWTWMNGTNFGGDPGNFGTQCVADAANLPAARYENRMCWADSCGKLWMLGGSNTYGDGNDLWFYDPPNDKWTWASGTMAGGSAGVYGIKGVSAPANMIPGKNGAHPFTDLSGNLWVFGGRVTGSCSSDLWRFVPDPLCGACSTVPVINFVASDRYICPNSCINFSNFTIGAISFQWTFPGGIPGTSTDYSPQFICYDTPGTYSVTLIASNSVTSDTITLNNLIHVYPQPIIPTITQVGNSLVASTGYLTYQWYFGSDTIPGATNNSFYGQQNGNYNLAVTDSNGCIVGVGILNVIFEPDGIEELAAGNLQLAIFPNPAKDKLYVTCYTLYGSEISFEIYNSMGQEIYCSGEKNVSGKFSKEISLKDFSEGIYVVQIKSSSAIAVKKFIIQK